MGDAQVSKPWSRASRPTRVIVAWVLTIWTGLLVLIMVIVGVRGGSAEFAFRFLYTGMVTGALGFSAWRAWAWVARWPDVAIRSGADTPPLPAESEPRTTHRGLSGKETPPTRW